MRVAPSAPRSATAAPSSAELALRDAIAAAIDSASLRTLGDLAAYSPKDDTGALPRWDRVVILLQQLGTRVPALAVSSELLPVTVTHGQEALLCRCHAGGARKEKQQAHGSGVGRGGAPRRDAAPTGSAAGVPPVLCRLTEPEPMPGRGKRSAQKSNMPDFRKRTAWLQDLQTFLAEDVGLPLHLFG